MPCQRNDKNEDISLQINRKLYDRLKANYPYAQMKALVEHIIAEHLQAKLTPKRK